MIGNGDIDSPEKVLLAFQKYGVDGVMIARAALGKPWIFKQAAALLRGEPEVPEPTLLEQRDILLRHQTSVVKRFGEERGNVLMRRYACCYAQGRRGAREFRSLISKCDTTEHFVRIVNTTFPLEHAEKTEWH